MLVDTSFNHDGISAEDAPEGGRARTVALFTSQDTSCAIVPYAERDCRAV